MISALQSERCASKDLSKLLMASPKSQKSKAGPSSPARQGALQDSVHTEDHIHKFLKNTRYPFLWATDKGTLSSS